MTADQQSMNEPATPAAGKPKPAGRKRRPQHRPGETRSGAPRTQPSQTRSFARNYGKKATGLARRRKRLADDAYGWVDDARGVVPGIAANMHLPSARRIVLFAAGNPVLMGAVGVGIGLIIGVLMPRNAFHTGMQGLGLAIASPPISPRLREGTRARPRK
jgi:hypothetical protein